MCSVVAPNIRTTVFSLLDSARIYLLKVNNRNTRTRCEICSKLTIKTTEQCQWRRSSVFIANFVHISHLVLVFSIVNFKYVNTGWFLIFLMQSVPISYY